MEKGELEREKKKEQIRKIYEALLKEYPQVKSRLLEPKRGNPVDVLIATVLSQATNDTLSERAFTRLKETFEGWEDVISADSGVLESVLSCGGLQKEKAKKIKAILTKINSDFGAITLEPLREEAAQKGFDYLVSLPGIGPKTAACTLSFGLGKPSFPVDTHILRILKRTGLFSMKDSAAKMQKEMESITPEEMKVPLHVMLIQHGREVCNSRKPKCSECTIKQECLFGLGENTVKNVGRNEQPTQ